MCKLRDAVGINVCFTACGHRVSQLFNYTVVFARRVFHA